MGCCGKRPEQRANTKVVPSKSDCDAWLEDDGPLSKRTCTDVPFLILFVAYLGFMGYICFLSYEKGDPFRVIFGKDSWGNTCNRKNQPIQNASFSGKDFTGVSKVFTFNFAAFFNTGPVKIPTTTLCVKQCPDTNLSSVSDMMAWSVTNNVTLCRYDIPPSSYTSGGDCPNLPIVEHDDLMNRCVPKSLLTLGESALGTVGAALNALEATCNDAGDFFQRSANDIGRSWKEILYLCLISIGVSFLVVILMRFIAAIIIWTLVIMCALVALAATAYCWTMWYLYKKDLDKLSADEQPEESKKRVKMWMIIAIPVTIAAVIILLILLIMRKRIALLVQLFREASKAVVKMPLLIFQPVWTFAFMIAFLTGLLWLYLYIDTAGDPVVDSDGKVEFKTNTEAFYLKWCFLFGILWIIQFVLACHFMTIAGAVASWYFTRDKSKLGWPIATSIKRLIVFHLGSVAFGSFIIALIWLARIILAYIQNKLRGRAGPVVDFLLKCLQCCLWCFEKFMKFINKNAYIMIAIYGYSFCQGAARGFSLLVSNALRVMAINSLGTFCLFLGKAGVVAISVVIGLEVFFKNNTEICYVWVPLGVAGLGSFLIAHTFLSVYGMAIDTIFLCFCEDSEKNDGINKPYFMSKGLMEFVENSRKAMAEQERREQQRKAQAEEADKSALKG